MALRKIAFPLIMTIAAFHVSAQQQRPIGGDRDAHGCLPSAGYIWSEAKHECVRLWEAAMWLPAVSGKQNEGAYLILSGDKKLAEVFMEHQPLLLKRRALNVYVNENYMLTIGKITQLKQDNVVIYSGELTKPRHRKK